MFDLHFHSDASDGQADFATVLAVVARHREIKLLALTDHDTIAASARLAALDSRAWIGAELTAFMGEMRVDLLGLNLRPDCAELNTYLADRATARRARFALFGQLLTGAGWIFEPSPEMLASPRLGQPHVARELRRHIANRDRLAALGLGADEASGRLIGGGDDAIYRLLDTLTPIIHAQTEGGVASSVEMVGLIHRAGGLAILPHPYIAPYDFGRRDRISARAMVATLVEAGLDGLERWHPDQRGRAVGQELAYLCTRHGLLASAGSDDHLADLSAFGHALPPGQGARVLLARLLAAAVTRRAGS